MRIEIHRTKLCARPLEDGRVAMSYDVLVPAAECAEGAAGTARVRAGSEYRAFPEATWAPRMPTGWARYAAWLEHERACQLLMLEWLHEHCPETAALVVYPLLWRDVADTGGPAKIAFEWGGEMGAKVADAVRATCTDHEYETWRRRLRAAAQARGGRSRGRAA